MELEDGFDDLLAEVCEPTSPKQPRLDQNDQQIQLPGTSNFWMYFVKYSILVFIVFTFSNSKSID